METRKFVLLDIDYITRNHTAVVRLFGKLLGEDDRVGSIMALDENFKPYLYVLPHNTEDCLKELHELEPLKVEKVSKRDNGVLKEFIKVTVKHPKEISKLKEKITDLASAEDVREYDIPFYRRYLIDRGLIPMNPVEVRGKILDDSAKGGTCVLEVSGEPKPIEPIPHGLNILSYNIETSNPRGRPDVKKDPILMISFHTNHGFKKVFTTKESSLEFVETVGSERELLVKFVETIRSKKPDIILGYNSDGFDFPYIKERAAKLNLPLKLGVDGSHLKFMWRGKRNSAVVKGRVHIDLYPNLRRNLPLATHNLQRVYKELFGKEIIDMPMDEIQTCWVAGGEKLDRFFRYSLEYVMAVTEIGEQFLPLSFELTRIVGQPLFDVARMGSGRQVEWHMIRKAFEYGDMVPNKFGKYLRDVVGGYVKEPVQGLYNDIYYFDFRSLYPSIIMAKNISPDTLTQDGEGCHITPEFGYKFKKEPVGFIPTVVGKFLENRNQTKSMMKETTDPNELQILNVKQEAFKRLANTVYGLFNHSTFRWYSIECSEAVTAWGRDFLKKTMDRSEEHGFKVLYADTDGFYAVLDEK